MNSLVTLENIAQHLGGREVLRDVSFSITSGTPLALVGPSGCGKSTLLHLIAGLAAPTAGSIRIEGRTVSKAGRILVPPHQRSIGMVFQDLALWPGLSALDNVAAGRAAGGHTSRKDRRAAAAGMLARCGLAGLEQRDPTGLSAGQQQRVALARALVSEPRLLLLDEPFTGLDLTVREEVLGAIAELAARTGVTVVLVSHDPWEISTLCRHAVVIEDATVAEQGELASLQATPASRTLRAMARLASASCR